MRAAIPRVPLALTGFLVGSALFAGCGSSTDPGGGGAISGEDRIAAIDAVSDKLENLSGADADARRSEMLAYLRASPEFEASDATEDGSLWARFTDGRLLLIIANRERATIDDIPPDDIDEGGEGESSGMIAAPAAGPPSHLPASLQARFLEGGEPPGSPSVSSDLKSMVRARHYFLAPGAGRGSIDDLKNVQDDGIFYFGGHGGLGQIRDLTRVFAVTSATVVSLENDVKYRDDWDNERLAYSIPIRSGFLPFLDSGDSLRPATGYYAFNAKFVRTYMRFSDHSVIYMAACNSSADAAFVGTFIQKGAGVYWGWTSGFQAGVDFRASKYVFDRMLGLNRFERRTPRLRPFDYVSIKEDMVRQNIDRSPQLLPGSYAYLTYTVGNTESGLMAPSIQYLDVDEATNTLYITGKFGREEPVVEINGQELDVKNHTDVLIEADIPPSGPKSAGNVVVWNEQRQSNTRVLSEWRPTFHLEFVEGHGSPPLKWGGDIELHFRADVTSYRDEVWEQPRFRDVKFTLARDSHGELTASGENVVNGTGQKWEGSAPIVSRIANPTAPNYLEGLGVIDTEFRQLRLFFYVVIFEGMKVVQVPSGDDESIAYVWAYGADGFLSQMLPLPAMVLPLDNLFGMTAASRRATEENPTAVLSWENHRPLFFAPDTVARSGGH
jgi:hypothetical protein